VNKDGQRTTQFHVGEPIGIRIKTVLAEDLYTFIKKIELSNGDGAKALLINNFCRPNDIKTLVFNYAETKHLFDTAGQGRFESGDLSCLKFKHLNTETWKRSVS